MYDEYGHDDLSFKPTIASIAKIVGKDAAAQILMDFGGMRIYIPHNPGAHSPLTVSIGLDAAQKIAQTYGGMDFTVPVNLGKDAEIKRLNAEGYSASAIARKVRCSLRKVYLVREQVEKENQLDLPM